MWLSPFVLWQARMGVLKVPWSPVDRDSREERLQGAAVERPGKCAVVCPAVTGQVSMPQGKRERRRSQGEAISVLETWVHIWLKSWLHVPQDSPVTWPK